MELNGPDAIAMWLVAFFVVVTVVVVYVVYAIGRWLRSGRSPYRYLRSLLDAEVPLDIQTPLSMEIVAERLSSDVSRFALPLFTPTALVGLVTNDTVKVRLHRPFLSGPLGPVFAGTMERRDGHTLIRGVFRLPRRERVFFTYWFVFLAVGTFITVLVGLVEIFEGGDEAGMPLRIIAGMWVFGIAFLKLALHIGAKDRHHIRELIADAIGGLVVRTSCPVDRGGPAETGGPG